MSWYFTISFFPSLTARASFHVFRPFRVGEGPTYSETVTVAVLCFPIGFFLAIDELVVKKSNPILWEFVSMQESM